MADQESMTDAVSGESELFDELRDALALLRDRSDDEEFRALIDDVLEGRRDLVEAATTPAFGTTLVTMMGGDPGDACGAHVEGEPCAPGDGAAPGSACAGCQGLCALRGAAPQQ
ncbi:MAG TPA: hypothetical protein VGI84_07860 [Pseudonocardiaceae bacterium]|jgi:hypothetical protein